MSVHDDSHARLLTRLALGEGPRDSAEHRELLDCPRCAQEARELLEMAERLAGMDRTRDSILSEVATAGIDPQRAARARVALLEAQRRAQAEPRQRRLRIFLVAMAATVLIGFAITLWLRHGERASDGRGTLLGQEHIELVVATRESDGRIELVADRAPRAGCRLLFVVLSSTTRGTLDAIPSSSATCTIPKERSESWPDTLEIYVQECDGANQVLASSSARSLAPRH